MRSAVVTTPIETLSTAIGAAQSDGRTDDDVRKAIQSTTW
jgi:hypothetical protein